MSLYNEPIDYPDEYCEECNKDLCRDEAYRDGHGRSVCRDCLENETRRDTLHNITIEACKKSFTEGR